MVESLALYQGYRRLVKPQHLALAVARVDYAHFQCVLNKIVANSPNKLNDSAIFFQLYTSLWQNSPNYGEL